MREEARFCGRSFHERPEVLRPLLAWAARVEVEVGLRMSPVKDWLGVLIVSFRFLPSPDIVVVCWCLKFMIYAVC